MNIRILTPSGTIREVKRVYPFAEATVKINGKAEPVLRRAKNLSYATGVLISLVTNEMGFGGDAVRRTLSLAI